MKKFCEQCRIERPVHICGGGASPEIQLCHECAKIWERIATGEMDPTSGICLSECYAAWERRAELGRSAKRERARLNRATREDAYRLCGLVKVRGALGGTYWE